MSTLANIYSSCVAAPTSQGTHPLMHRQAVSLPAHECFADSKILPDHDCVVSPEHAKIEQVLPHTYPLPSHDNGQSTCVCVCVRACTHAFRSRNEHCIQDCNQMQTEIGIACGLKHDITGLCKVRLLGSYDAQGCHPHPSSIPHPLRPSRHPTTPPASRAPERASTTTKDASLSCKRLQGRKQVRTLRAVSLVDVGARSATRCRSEIADS